MISVDVNPNGFVFDQTALEHLLGQRIFQILLDRPPHRPGPVFGIVSLVDQKLLGLLIEFQQHLLLPQSLQNLFDFQRQDFVQVLPVQRPEHDQIVQAIDELRIKRALGLFHDPVAHDAVSLPVLSLGEADDVAVYRRLGTDIRSHQNDGVPKIHRPPETVGQLALLENLQDHVGHVRMSLFDFVEQDYRIRFAPDLLGQLAAFLEPDIPRGRSDQSGNRELLHVLAHVQMDQILLVAEHLHGNGLR